MGKEASEMILVWLRRDLRLKDNKAVSEALKLKKPIQFVFFFDPEILEKLPSPEDARVQFIHDELQKLNTEIEGFGGKLWVFHEKPLDGFKKIFPQHLVAGVYCNEDYEPPAVKRDTQVAKLCEAKGIPFLSFKDQVIFAKSEVMTDKGTPYTVFGAYKKKWLKTLTADSFKAHSVSDSALKEFVHKTKEGHFPSLQKIGFKTNDKIKIPPLKISKKIIETYEQTRDFPASAGTTRLGLHLRFGTISVRELAKVAQELNATYLSELIWREFFMQILFHFPETQTKAFTPKFDEMPWRTSKKEFEAWCEGQTGVPIVDAGMRELNETGFMHNRVRMIVGSYLTKHLLMDWRKGEAYFAEKLLDYEMSSNVGNWQWVAGSGCDAAPYFRVFNPTIQTKRFDKDHKYIKKWVPEYESVHYPDPIVSHEEGRDRALRAYYRLSKK